MRKSLSLIAALILAAVGAVPGFAQTASTPFSSPWYFAASFGLWSINQQAPNTYIFQGRTLCNSNAQNLTFFVFSTSAPVWIADNNTANSETVTPSAVTNTAGSCGVTLATSNNHYTFQLKSGTGGLQEALNTLSGSTTGPARVILDRNWYAQAANVPGTSPRAIIAAAVGGSGIVLEDITTSPSTFYTANASGKYTPSLATAGLPNLKVTSYTAIAAPTALTTVAGTCATNGGGCITTAVTGGTIPTASAYTLGATCIDGAGGETTLSVDTAGGATVTSGAGSTNSISVTSPAGCTTALGAVGWRLYMTAASGASLSEILYSPTCTNVASTTLTVFPATTTCAIGSTATITAIITGTAKIPLVATAYPRTSGSSQSWPPFTAGGTLASASVGEMGHVNFPAGWFNVLGRSIQFCGNGYATTNGTGGTITFSTDLASIYGVTTITPFTAVSGTIAASTIQAPFDFCVTYATSATGATGTLEAHGCVNYGVAGTAVGTVSCDIIFVASSTVDLTKADTLVFNIKPTTAGLTAYQLRQLTAYPSN